MKTTYKDLMGDREVVRLHTVLAELLDLDPQEVRKKLKPLPDKIVEIIKSNKRFTISNVVEIYPILLPPGEFLHTVKKKKVQVPARYAARVKLKQSLQKACKQGYIPTEDFY